MAPRVIVLSLVMLAAAAPARAQNSRKFSLSMFHFNLQYVPGGLQGFPSGHDQNPDFDLDHEAVEDLIVTESFEPVLDLFLAHPGWKVNLEMQAYMIEVMKQRHPGVLAKLKLLVDAGAAELSSVHYSDQLLLAYPRRSLEWSFDLMDEVFAGVGFAPGPVVFAQEGQFGEGMAEFLATRGRTILGLSKNLFRYQHAGALDTAPAAFSLGQSTVVLLGRSFATPQVEVEWNFFDDGELLATGGQAPYMGKAFKKSASAIAAYEQELLDAEARGFEIAGITDFVDFLETQNLPRPELPRMLDGTWQPKSTDSMKRWLGASGLLDLAYGCERDNQVLTQNTVAHHWLRVAETVIAHAEKTKLIETGSLHERWFECLRHLLWAQVSDASGINPFLKEVQYGLFHGGEAQRCAQAIIDELTPGMGGPYLEVDTARGTVSPVEDLPFGQSDAVAAFFTAADGYAVEAPGRTVSEQWERIGGRDNLFRLTVTASPPQNGERFLEVVFPHTDSEGFALMSGLVEDRVVSYPLDSFEFEEGRISLPLPAGLVRLRERLWLVAQTDTVHVAATFRLDDRVRFADETLDPGGEAQWVFWIYQGEEAEALALARRLNVSVIAYLQTGTPDAGCGCGPAAAPRASAGLAALFLLALVRRLSRRRNPSSSS